MFLVFTGSVADSAIFTSDEHEVIQAHSYDEIVAFEQVGKLRSLIVPKAINDNRVGKILPLEAVRAWHAYNLSSITVEKDHRAYCSSLLVCYNFFVPAQRLTVISQI